MPIHQIKVGDYVRELFIRKLKDDTTEEDRKYYLILDVPDNTLEVIVFSGSPLPNSQVHEIEDLMNDYVISVIDAIESERIYRTYTNEKNYICQEFIGEQYSWDGKTVLIPASNLYYSGNGIWRELPVGLSQNKQE